MTIRVVAVVGARSQIGASLLAQLSRRGVTSAPIGRSERGSEGIHRYVESEDRFVPPLEHADALINVAPLPTIDVAVAMARRLGARRLVAFGSTGTHFKAKSTSAHERDFVRQQLEAEDRLRVLTSAAGIQYTLFRPTMVYGAGADLNVTFIARVLRRFRFFLLPLGVEGRRQPVHVDDLAVACIAALEAPQTCGKAYDLGGGEVLRYSEMVRRIAAALGQPARLVRPPLALVQLALRLLRLVPRYRFLDPAMVSRMAEDLVIDNTPAVRDFGYAPRGFSPTAAEVGGGRGD